MSRGAPALNRINKKDPSGPPFVASAAHNGLSVDAGGFIVLGNDVAGVTAMLLSDREIPTAGFDIRMSGLGNLVVGSNAGLSGKLQLIGTGNSVQQLIKLPAAQTITNPFLQVTDSANTPIFEMRALTINNLFIGPNVGKTLTTGFGNVGVGCILQATVACLGAITTGNENTAVGSRSLASTTTGSGNCAFGDATMQLNISGSNNCAMGQDTLSQGTTSSRCVAFGTNAGKGVAGFSNFTRTVIVGCFSCNKATAGDDNVTIGDLAAGCQAGAAAHGAGNVVIGSAALANMAMGARNILIGFQSHVGSIVGNDVISLGAANIAAGNNTTLVGNGMTAAVANVAGFGTNTQNVIIGQINIAADNGQRLQVNGGVSFSDAAAVMHAVVAMTDGAGVAAGTLLTAPVAGNPTKWLPFDDNGTTRMIPSW